MKHTFKLFLLLLTTMGFQVNAQQISPQKLGFTPFSITDKTLGTINYYIHSNQIDKPKPVLLYIDGSGAYPLFQKMPRGYGSTVVIDFRNLSNDYHVVLISKPGIPFADSVSFDAKTGYPNYATPKTYTEKLSLDWRVGAANLVLKQILQTQKVDKSKVAVLGISEGFQVGAKLATINHDITHLILMVGNGLTQFYDFIIQNRTDAQKGIIGEQTAKANIDSLFKKFKEIYANPQATDKEWYGHTYLRWSSFSVNNPTENLMSLSIPIYLVGASNDQNTTVLSTDYLYLESIRLGKRNITYKVYPYDHSFNEISKEDKAGTTTPPQSHLKEVLGEAFTWLKNR